MIGSLFGGRSTFAVDPNYAAMVDAVPSYTGIQRYTSAQALPIALHWGTRRLTPNVIWQSDLTRQYPNGNPGSALLPIQSTTPVGFGNMSVGLLPVVNPTNPTDASALSFGAVFLGGLIVGTFPTAYAVGSADLSSSQSVLMVPTILAMCEGPIDATAPLNTANGVNRVWNGSGQAALLWSQIFANVFSLGGAPYPSPVSPYYYVANGAASQAVWPFFTASSTAGIYPSQNLTYGGTAYIATPFHVRGHDGTLPQQSFEVCKTAAGYSQLDSYSLGLDMSPAYILQDFLTNVQYGMGLMTADIDSTSLAIYRSYCGAQGIWLSPLLTSQSAATDFIDRLALESNSWIYWGGTTVYFVPLGDEALSASGYTYTPTTSAAYALSVADFLTPLQVDRADPIDCFNRVRFEISDRQVDYAANPLEWQETTLINKFGLRDASDFSADDICDRVVGAISLDLYAKRMAYLRNTYTFTVSYKMILLLPGTIVTLTDPTLGLVAVPARVRTIDEDTSGGLQIVAEEYPGSIGIARPLPSQVWSTSGGTGTSGTSTNPIGGSSGVGPPISTSGGTGTLATPNTAQLVLFVAGDVITLPAGPTAGQLVYFKHDLQRSVQPTPSNLESNPVTFQRPSGATYTIEDPEDATLAAVALVTGRTTGETYLGTYDGGSPGVWRWLRS